MRLSRNGRPALSEADVTQQYSFTILGPPRTKKTSNRIFRAGKRIRIAPSAAHERWFAWAMSQLPTIRYGLRLRDSDLPLCGSVHVKATFYRDANRGDLIGYEQALADWLQAPKGKRSGAGIIVDDKQIVSWDGSRLAVDRERPRIEVQICGA